jgi:hypothetical protein
MNNKNKINTSETLIAKDELFRRAIHRISDEDRRIRRMSNRELEEIISKANP